MNEKVTAPNYRSVNCCGICKHAAEPDFSEWDSIYGSCKKHKEIIKPHEDSDYEFEATLRFINYHVCDDFEPEDGDKGENQ